jgi:hypothetical protein
MTDPVKQRSALEKQLASAQEQYGNESSLRQTSEIAVHRARRILANEHKARAAGQSSDKAVTTAERAVEQANAAHQRHAAAENQALDAAKGLGWDLTNLLRRHPEVFAEQAEAVTQAAGEALEAAADAIRDAQTAWDAAVAAWLPVCRAQGIAGVEPFPLPDPDGLTAEVRRGALLPRPQAVTVAR